MAPIPGNNSELHPNAKCFGCNKFRYYRNKCSSQTGRDRELQGTNLPQVVDDTWITDSDNESQVGFAQIVEGDKYKKNDKPKEDKDVGGKKLLKGICINQQVPEQLKLPKGLIVINSASSYNIFGEKSYLLT